MQILGIGRTGHIGFNEPGSAPNSGTRLVTLDDLTRNDASRDFGGKQNVPTKAITMGIGTIFKAREIILMAWSERKRPSSKKQWKAKYQVKCLPLTCNYPIMWNLCWMKLPPRSLPALIPHGW